MQLKVGIFLRGHTTVSSPPPLPSPSTPLCFATPNYITHTPPHSLPLSHLHSHAPTPQCPFLRTGHTILRDSHAICVRFYRVFTFATLSFTKHCLKGPGTSNAPLSS